MKAVESCPAHRYDHRDGEPVVCLLDARQEEAPQRSWTFICLYCWTSMLDARARRKEWEVD